MREEWNEMNFFCGYTTSLRCWLRRIYENLFANLLRNDYDEEDWIWIIHEFDEDLSFYCCYRCIF